MMFDIGQALQDAFDDGYRKRDAEIVRCKDCKHYDGEYTYPMCWRYEDTIKPDDYCSYGEKTEVEK